jgi:hypothetical protein
VPKAGDYRSNMGLGLFITRRLVEENRGQMMIVSQKDAVHYSGHLGRRSVPLRKAFPGTFVVVILDPDNPLPLEEVYEEATRSVVGEEPALQLVDSVQSGRPVTASIPAPTPAPAPSHASKTTAGLQQALQQNGRRLAEQPIVLELRHFGTELLTRDVGLAVRAELATRLLQAKSVIVDLDGISDITPSVADEAFGKLAAGLGVENFQTTVAFRGGSSIARRLIEFVVKNRVK